MNTKRIILAIVLLGAIPAYAEEQSADQVAKELANPNTPLASLRFKLQYRTYEGDLDGADDQNGTTVVFQPVLPFKLDGEKVFFVRPSFNFITESPLPQGGGAWDDESGFGDISFDVGIGSTDKETGVLTAYGLAGSLPTGDDDLGLGETTALGPEFLYGKIGKKSILGFFPNHIWDVGGDVDVSLTTIQMFGIYLPGGGWSVGSSPIMTYDHENDQATIPLNLSVSKTVIWDVRPWKLGINLDYYVESDDDFAPEWQFEFNFAPVVQNRIAEWVR